MFNEYYEAANKISQLADEFADCDEVCSTLKNASLKIAKMAEQYGAILKLATAKEITEKTE
jgi:hypothetical protein